MLFDDSVIKLLIQFDAENEIDYETSDTWSRDELVQKCYAVLLKKITPILPTFKYVQIESIVIEAMHNDDRGPAILEAIERLSDEEQDAFKAGLRRFLVANQQTTQQQKVVTTQDKDHVIASLKQQVEDFQLMCEVAQKDVITLRQKWHANGLTKEHHHRDVIDQYVNRETALTKDKVTLQVRNEKLQGALDKLQAEVTLLSQCRQELMDARQVLHEKDLALQLNAERITRLEKELLTRQDFSLEEDDPHDDSATQQEVLRLTNEVRQQKMEIDRLTQHDDDERQRTEAELRECRSHLQRMLTAAKTTTNEEVELKKELRAAHATINDQQVMIRRLNKGQAAAPSTPAAR